MRINKRRKPINDEPTEDLAHIPTCACNSGYGYGYDNPQPEPQQWFGEHPGHYKARKEVLTGKKEKPKKMLRMIRPKKHKH